MHEVSVYMLAVLLPHRTVQVYEVRDHVCYIVKVSPALSTWHKTGISNLGLEEI